MNKCCKQTIIEILTELQKQSKLVTNKGFGYSVKTRRKRELIDFFVLLKKRYKITENIIVD